MTDQEFNLATADKYQMKFFALESCDGMKLSMAMSEQTMREKIEAHHIQNDLDMPVSEIVVPAHLKTKTMFTINIPKSPLPNGDEPVFVGVQGVGYTIPRGVNVKVTEGIVEVLRNAIQDNITQDDEGTIHHNEAPAYPFQIVERHEAAAA
jgi:hypothetical protein